MPKVSPAQLRNAQAEQSIAETKTPETQRLPVRCEERQNWRLEDSEEQSVMPPETTVRS